MTGRFAGGGEMSLRLAIPVFVIAVVVAGCGETGARADRPDVVDEWLPPVGVDLDSERIYQENRPLFDYDMAGPLDIREVATERSEGVNSVDLTYASPKGGRVPATLFVPEGDGPFAGLVLMHGLPSNRTEMAGVCDGLCAIGRSGDHDRRTFCPAGERRSRAAGPTRSRIGTSRFN